MNKNLTQDKLKELLKYNPITGVFTWRVKRSGARGIGSVAGFVDNLGYRIIKLHGRSFKAHRLAFLYMENSTPEEVDHIDNIKDNNRWRNLRHSSRIQNMQNSLISKANTSGVKGVCWSKKTGKWLARLCVKKERINLGYFEKLEDAKSSIMIAREKYHKEFANHGKT